MNYLVEENDDSLGRPLNDLQIVEEVLSFFFAGSGTTANTLIFLVWAVLKDPGVHGKLVSELRMRSQTLHNSRTLKLCRICHI